MGCRKLLSDDPLNRIIEIALSIAIKHIQIANEQITREVITGILHNLSGQRVPKVTTVRRNQRNAKIRIEHAGGVSIAELAAKYFLGKKQIIRILKVRHE